MTTLTHVDTALCSSISQAQPIGCARVLQSIRLEATRIVKRSLLLDDRLAFAITSANDGVDGILPLEEKRLFTPRASSKRLREWASGRRAARLALKQLGFENSPPILRGDGGEPLWPEGVVGSITHCYPWSLAMVVRSSAPLSIGIDLESQLRMGKVDISSVVCRKPELEWIFADGDCQARLMMIFSAKEAVYKALHPVCRKYIDFQDVELSWVPEESRFVVRFSAAFEERFLVNRVCSVHCWQQDTFVFTCSTLQTL
ncbi:MAG: hypothetical protein DMG64_03980 [Acidobacteria bacterium]|nr:MAG: hypothetical protein DMG63_04405 [Acidobacteriota bacterium]PYY04932.1 MAG: hypothetical protein DMG64_03980 [Acidobacteriota bacterium]PYY23098.1 MAG: hypothetical protein DMG62_09655 [Acidobacteriota bacterium]